MRVTCPSCTTIYRIADDLLKGTKPTFRCSRCKHIFDLEPAGSTAIAETAQTAEFTSTHQGTDEEPTFPFGREEVRSGAVTLADQADAGKTAVAWPDRSASPVEEEAQHTPPPHQAESPTRKAREHAAGQPNSRSGAHRATPAAKSLDGGLPPPQGNVAVLDPHRDQQASTLPYLTLFALLTLFFSLTAAFQYAYPEALEAMIKKIPLVGSAVVRNAHLKNNIELQSLRGSYQTIQGNREIFMITGIAMNQNPVVIREIRLAGETYSEDAKPLEQQSMWIGNAISPKLIRGMTLQDIADLQRLKPLRTFEIPPGDSVPFTIVFLKSTKSVKNFTCQVLAAEGEV